MSMPRSQRLVIVSTAIMVVSAVATGRAMAQTIITEIIRAGLVNPRGIAVDTEGNTYVTGFGSDNAFKITPAGVITEIIDMTGDGAGNGLDGPIGIAVDAAGNAYVTGGGNFLSPGSNNAFKITPAGVITEIIDATGDGAGNILDGPFGIAVDAAGIVYVTGAFSDNAFKITPAGVITQIIDTTGDGSGNRLDGPVAIAVDAAGNAYMTGFSSDNAFKITPDGVITEIIDRFGDGAGNHLDSPVGIAVDAVGNAYVAGNSSDNAFKITPTGVITEIIDATGDGEGNGLDRPGAIAVDAVGNAYVVGGFNSNNAFKITPAGVITEIIDATGDGAGNGVSQPLGIAVDAAGNAYVTGFSSNNAFKITPAGVITQIIDMTGDGSGNGLNGPVGIALDGADNVYVTGADSHNAFMITPAGVITQIIDATGDGAGNTLSFPFGIAVDAAVNVYVTGAGSDNAFKITPAGVITQIIDHFGDGAGNLLDIPIGVTVDTAGNAYVTGASSDNAFKITPSGVITEIIDSFGAGAGSFLDSASGITADAAGNVFVTGAGSDNAFKITPAGTITEIIDEFGDGGGNRINGACAIAVDAAGNAFVTGRLSDNAFKITPAGVITEIIDATGDGAGNFLSAPIGIAVDGVGHAYVTGEGSDNAFKITSGGVITEIIDAAGDGGDSFFNLAQGIAVDTVGTAYVAGRNSDNAFMIVADCNLNGIPDEDDIANGTSLDCNANVIPDECEPDCNENGVADSCDIANGTASDCNLNGIPDECEPDCNGNGTPDPCEILDGTASDCNLNGIPDDCEPDCNNNGIPDECEPDCNGNGTPNPCEILDGTASDCNANGIPDDCEVLGFTQQAKLTAADATATDLFGRSVSISGNTAVIGAIQDDDAGTNSGSAYIFVFAGGVWTQQAKLTATDGSFADLFGYSVSISGDTAVIGARGGSAYVFVRSAGIWTQQAELTAADGANGDLFGSSVSISGDTAIVGAKADDDAGLDSGSAYVFVRTGGVWTQQAKLTAADSAAGDQFGHSASISGDTAAIGSTEDSFTGSAPRSAYIFVRTGTVWTQQAKLTAANASIFGSFSNSVSISGDTTVIGSSGDNDAGSMSGSASVFVRTGAVWTQQAKLTAADATAGDLFGFSVSISGDTAIIGAFGDDDAGNLSGSAYVFVRTGGGWTQRAKLSAADATDSDLFGWSVSISGDTAVIGAWQDDDAGDRSGSAYIFARASDCDSNGIPDECDIANGTSPDCNANGIPDECEAVVLNLGLDIKPGACPNAFNRSSHGVLPVALLGAADFDITTVDVSSIRLSRADGVGGAAAPNEGPPGPHSVFEDVATPVAGQTCDCHDLTGDDILDLSMHFASDDVVEALGLNDLAAGALVELVLGGCLLDGTTFRASDCLRLVPPGTASGTLAVQSDAAGAWIDVGPLDNTLDGGGFADFQRNYFQGTVVTLTAPRFAGNRLFTGWLIDGAASGVAGERSIDLTVSGDHSALATYVDLALGDVNRDGTVDGGDIQGFVDILVAPTGAGDLDSVLADLNGDNQVDLADATQFVQMLLGPA